MRFVIGFFRFWYDFIVGDAWEIATGVVLVLAVAAALLSTITGAEAWVPPLVAAGVILVVAASLLAEARRRIRA